MNIVLQVAKVSGKQKLIFRLAGRSCCNAEEASKLVERLAGARAIGPIFSGLNWPINDLWRGCSVDDIIDMLGVTSIMASSV
jgi:hypothetical protein